MPLFKARFSLRKLLAKKNIRASLGAAIEAVRGWGYHFIDRQ